MPPLLPDWAGRSVMIAVTVRVKAAAGRTLHATATISPTDTTPATGTSTDKVIIRALGFASRKQAGAS